MESRRDSCVRKELALAHIFAVLSLTGYTIETHVLMTIFGLIVNIDSSGMGSFLTHSG